MSSRVYTIQSSNDLLVHVGETQIPTMAHGSSHPYPTHTSLSPGYCRIVVVRSDARAFLPCIKVLVIKVSGLWRFLNLCEYQRTV